MQVMEIINDGGPLNDKVEPKNCPRILVQEIHETGCCISLDDVDWSIKEVSDLCMIFTKSIMRLQLILVLFLAFSFAQATTIKKREAVNKFMALDVIESKVDAIVTIATQLQTSPFVNPVKLIAAYLDFQDAISKSTDLCKSHPDPFTAMQAEILIARTTVLSKKLEGVLIICERLGKKIGLFSPRIVYRVLLTQMKLLIVEAASCYSSHVPPAERDIVQGLLKAIVQVLDKSLAKVQ
jgi:hypothetical protein